MKDEPRYRAIHEFERELKNNYAKNLGEAFSEVAKELVEFSKEEQKKNDTES